MTPYEIMGVPFTLYAGAIGTTFPLIDADPGVGWTMVGTSGDRNYSDDGVTVAHSQSLNLVRGAGATGPQKAFRKEEDLVISLTLWDMTLEQYALGLNSNEVAATAAGVGTAGFKTLAMYQGVEVATMALLIRGNASAYGEGWKSQYEIPVCFQSGNPQPVFTKGDPAGLALEFTALEDPNAASEAARFGRLVMQHAVALAE